MATGQLVLEFDRPKASREHPTMKPLALWAELMGNSTGRGEPFPPGTRKVIRGVDPDQL